MHRRPMKWRRAMVVLALVAGLMGTACPGGDEGGSGGGGGGNPGDSDPGGGNYLPAGSESERPAVNPV
jgi:hypothetical protein